MDREVTAALRRGEELLRRRRVLDAQRQFYRALDASGGRRAVKLRAAELWRTAGWTTLMDRKDPENGWTMFHNARALLRSLDGRASASLWEVERGMAIASGKMGEHEEALLLCGDAERHARVAEDRAKVWNTRAIALSYLGRAAEARRWVERVLRTSKAPETIRVARQTLGLLHLAAKNPDVALEHLEDKVLRAWAHLEAGRPREVLKLAPNGRARSYLLRARAFLALQQPRRATGELRRGIRVIEEDREAMFTESALTAFQGAREEAYSLLVKICMERGRVEEAFQYAEASRARSFLDFLVDLEFEGRRGLDHLRPGEKERFEFLRRRLDELEERTTRNPRDSSRLSLLQAEYRMALRRYQKEQQAKNPVLPVYPEKSKAVASSLPKGDAILQYHVVDNAIACFFISRKGLWARMLTENASEILGAAKDLSAAVALARRGERTGSQAFFNWHLSTLGSELLGDLPLEGIERLHVVPHGALHLVPFGALRVRGRHLIDRCAVALAPSASVCLTLRERAQSAPAPSRCLLVKDPSDSLSQADAEEQALRNKFGDGLTVLSGPAAGREAVLAMMPGNDVIHFSTHAIFRPEHPEFSYLELSGGQKLYAGDLIAADLTSVRLVTLSACDTGRGDFSRASEMVGLPRAFLLAGAGAVLATLWPVEDHPGLGDLMKRFYTKWGRVSAGRAVQLAQREGAGADMPASVWASFALIGT